MAGNFYAVQCPDCDNEQIVFSKAATEVACAVCGATLARPTGGDAEIEGEVTDTVERRSASSRTESDNAAQAQ
ncbi:MULTISPECIES: 30S ribosomal protein S27e [Halorussus]|uniref:30S ribosomal protein S27e n=1 Tax=Halorussus TaxID=1070314 RepID=UPI000E21896A|nr:MULTISPECIES: 30S ribosomal protein S27e [Halorussus]NHN58034.1 30S ribosomal protein S27e [Halorussus sp. JP-T4]